MEDKLKAIYDYQATEGGMKSSFEDFKAFYSQPQNQVKLYDRLKSQDLIQEGKTAEMFTAEYFGYGEKKKPDPQQEAPQVAASSPAPGQQPAMGSEPTGEQQITILPPGPVKEQPAKASPDELIVSLMGKPTEQLLYSYAVGTLGDEQKIAEFGKRFAKEENRKPLNDLLSRLENIRNQPGDNSVKMAQAQREVALSMDRFARDTDYAVDYSGPLAAGFADQYAKTVSGMEKTNPAAYKQLMEDRVRQSALSKRMDEKDYRTMLDASGLRAAYGIGEEGADGSQQLPPEFQEADLRMAVRSIENRDYSYAADNPAFVEKKKQEDATQIAEMTARADQLRADRLAEFDGMITAAKATLDRLPGVPADNRATRQIAALEKERGYLLNPAKQVADVYAALGDEIKSAPGKTPLEKAQNHFQRLSQEQKDLWEVMSQGGAGEFVGDQIGQMFGGTNDVTLRYGEVTKQLKALAPVVALNEAAIMKDGFTDSFLPAFMGGMYGGVVEATGGMSRQEMSSSMLQAMQVAGITEQDLQPKALEMSKKRMEEYGLGDAAYYGDILGSSAGIALPLMVGGSVTAPLKLPRMAAGTSLIGKIIAPVVNTSIKAAKTGGTYELTGQVFQNQQEELNFASGFFGGIGSEVVGSAVNKMGARAVATLFGDKAPEAMKTIGRFGALSLGSGTGETAEEFAQTITQIAQSSDTFEQFQRKVGEQFPDWSSAAKFAFTTMIMGTGMAAGNNIGEALGKSGQQLIDALPADESVAVKAALQQLAEESVGATQEIAAEAQAELTPQEKAAKWVDDEFARQEAEIEAEKAANAPSPTVEWTGDQVAPVEQATALETPATEAAPMAEAVAQETAAEPAMEANPAAELRGALDEIAASDMGDIKVLATGFADMFGEGMEIDFNALESLMAPEGAAQADRAVEAPVEQKAAKPRAEKKPAKVVKPTSVVDDAKNEAIDPSPATEKAAEQRVEKIVSDVEKKVAAKTKGQPRPKQQTVKSGDVITEYVKMDPGAHRLTEYRKDDSGNWFYRNAKVGTTPSTKNREYQANWQPVANTPQAKDNIERLAASPVRTDLKNAIEELRAETRGMFRLSAISDPMEVAKQQKKVIDAAINVGAKFIKVGVSDFNDWLDSMAQVTGDAIRKQPKLAELIFRESQKRAAAEQPAPEQQQSQQPEQKKEAPKEKAKPKEEPSGSAASSTKIKSAEGEGAEKERGAVTTMRESGALDATTEAMMPERSRRYRVRSRDQVEKEVKEHIEQYGVKGVREAVMDLNSDMPFDARVTAAKAIMQHYKTMGGTDAEKNQAMKDSAEMASFLAEFGTMLGQGVSAMAGWMDGLEAFGPEFMGQYAEKYVRKVQDTILQRTKGNDTTARESMARGSQEAGRKAAESSRVQQAIDESAPPSIASSTKEQFAARKAAAAAKFHAAAAKLGGSARSGVDVGAFADMTAALAEYGVVLVAEGVTNFKAWAAKMKKDLGDVSDADLEKAWQTTTEDGSPEQVSMRMAAATRLNNILKGPAEKAAKDPLAQVARIVRAKVVEAKPRLVRDKVEIVAEAVVNAEKYADAWRGAVAEVEQAIDAGPGTTEAKEAKKEAVRSAVEDAIGKPFTDAQVKAAVRARMKEAGNTIKDLLADEDTADMQEQEIAASVAALGLPQDQADKIAAAFKAEYDAMLAKARKDALIRTMGQAGKRYFGIVDNMGSANPSDAEWRAMLAKKYDLPVMTEKDMGEVLALAKEAAEMPEGSHQRAKAAAKVLGRIGRVEGIDKAGIFWDYYYANMLSGPMTHARNIIGNLYNLAAEIAISGIEQTIATGDPTTIFKSFSVAMKGVMEMGMASAQDAFTSGTSSKGGKFENPGDLESIGKDNNVFLRALSNWKYVSRMLAAEDMFFYHGFRALRMSEIIRTDGRAKGLKGAALRSYVNNKMYGTDAEVQAAKDQVEAETQRFNLSKNEQKIRMFEILDSRHKKVWRDKAEEYGSYGTFNYAPRGVLGSISDAINNIKERKAVGGKPGRWVNLIVPFTRVPANILNQQLSYTPWGFVRLLSKSKSEDFGLTNRQERNRELIKAVIGTMYLGVIPMLLAAIFSGDDEDGNPYFAVHGSGPADYRKRAFLAASGWRPNTIQVGPLRLPFEGTSVALPLSITGSIMDMLKYGKPKKDDMVSESFMTGAVIMSTVFKRSFLTNMGDLLKTLGEGEKAGDALQKLLVRTTATPIPGYPLAKQATSMIEPVKYKSNRFFQEYASGIGFVRDWAGVKPELDAFGRPVKLFGTNPWEVAAEIIDKDPVAGEMIKHNLWFSPPAKGTKIAGEEVDDDELYQLTEKAGKLSYDMIKPNLLGWISQIESATEETKEAVTSRIQDEIDKIRSRNIDYAKTTITRTSK